MADGYSQVFDDSGFVVLCFQRHKGLLDNLLCCVYCHSINTTFRLMACKRVTIQNWRIDYHVSFPYLRAKLKT